MDRKKAIIVEHIDENGLRILNGNKSIEIIYFDGTASRKTIAASLKDANAVMVRSTPVTRIMIENSPKLEVIAKHGVGVDNVDVAAATEMKIPVTITPETNSDAVAELAMSLMLSLARNLIQADADLKAGRFTRKEHYSGVELGGKTVGIIGLGRIGSRVAMRCSAGFGMQVLAYDPFIEDHYARRFNAVLLKDLEPVLREADFVTIHAPLTELTKNMIGEAELWMMKEDAFILNTARGGIIDEAALYRALLNRRIKGAGLDVFLTEPPHPEKNPLLALDNVVVTPHIGAGTKESLIKMATVAAEEIIRVLNGKRPNHPVNPEIYDEPQEKSQRPPA